MRQMLGVPTTPWGAAAKVFARQTLRDNVALLDDALLQQINARVAAAGREVFAKKDGAPVAALEVKVDTYVLETDVHFPTDLNLLWDASRKCVALLEKFRDQFHYSPPGWRKAQRLAIGGSKRWNEPPAASCMGAASTRKRGGARACAPTWPPLASSPPRSAPACWNSVGQPVELRPHKGLSLSRDASTNTVDLVARRRCCTKKRSPPHEKVFLVV